MKKLFLLVFILIMASTSCQTSKEDTKMSSGENKKISTLYHERNLEDVDKLLADDFVGSYYRSDINPTIWNKENHKNAITNYPNVKDSILIQIAEDDWVAERFIRTYKNEGIIMKAEVMQFKQFNNGKIIKSWEIFSPIDTI